MQSGKLPEQYEAFFTDRWGETALAMRSLADMLGPEKLLRSQSAIPNGLGDLMKYSEKEKDALRKALRAGFGEQLLSQTHKRPTEELFRRNVDFLSAQTGMPREMCAQIAACFDFMLDRPARFTVRSAPPPVSDQHRKETAGRQNGAAANVLPQYAPPPVSDWHRKETVGGQNWVAPNVPPPVPKQHKKEVVVTPIVSLPKRPAANVPPQYVPPRYAPPPEQNPYVKKPVIQNTPAQNVQPPLRQPQNQKVPAQLNPRLVRWYNVCGGVLIGGIVLFLIYERAYDFRMANNVGDISGIFGVLIGGSIVVRSGVGRRLDPQRTAQQKRNRRRMNTFYGVAGFWFACFLIACSPLVYSDNPGSGALEAPIVMAALMILFLWLGYRTSKTRDVGVLGGKFFISTKKKA